jgi:hypothetical protein
MIIAIEVAILQKLYHFTNIFKSRSWIWCELSIDSFDGEKALILVKVGLAHDNVFG